MARDPRCPEDVDGYRMCLAVRHNGGVCANCRLGSCAHCDAPMTAAEAASSQLEIPGGSVYCPACRALEDAEASRAA